VLIEILTVLPEEVSFHIYEGIAFSFVYLKLLEIAAVLVLSVQVIIINIFRVA